jgi:hypothetical protein
MSLMPRIKKPPTPDVPVTIAKINNFCESNGISVNHLAHLAGVGQPALYRFLEGKRKTVTIAAHQAVKIIDSWHNNNYVMNAKHMDKHTASEIMKLVLALWDGDPETLGTLSEFIRAAAPLYQVVLANRHRSR